MTVFVHRLPVRFDDVDHAGIVYYPRFFHFFHVAFEEFLRSRLGQRGYLALLDERHLGFPAVSAACTYRAPLRFGDDAAIALEVARIGRRLLAMRYRVSRVRDGEPQVLSAEGEVVVAVTDLVEFRAIELPPDLHKLFLELLGPGG